MALYRSRDEWKILTHTVLLAWKIVGMVLYGSCADNSVIIGIIYQGVSADFHYCSFTFSLEMHENNENGLSNLTDQPIY